MGADIREMSSGDVRADRRLDFAMSCRAAGDLDGAADVLAQTIDLAPRWPVPRFVLGEVLAEQGRRDEAVDAFAAYLKLAEEDVMGATARLVALGAAPTPDSLPAAYVATLFDQYAPRFDDALLNRLGYVGPMLLRAAVDSVKPSTEAVERVLDLGCGTGLAGEAFRDRAARLTGVDVSPGMIAEARRKALYDGLEVVDALAAVAGRRDAYDLVLAADVVIYLGALEPLFDALGTALAPGGLFAFTTQAWDGEGFVLGADCRYAHSPAYLEAAAARAGLDVVKLDAASCRKEAGRDVPGLVAVLRRPTVQPSFDATLFNHDDNDDHPA